MSFVALAKEDGSFSLGEQRKEQKKAVEMPADKLWFSFCH
jgi:hypothetical protein